MSRRSEVTVICEKCRKEFNVEKYDSINATLDPELRNKFITNEIYLFKCPHCGNMHYKPYPVLYHDMEHKFMVQGGNLIDVYNFHNFSFNDSPVGDLINEAKKDYVLTGATSTVLAIEKVIALENGLDHRIATMYRVIETERYKRYAKEHDMPKPENSYLYYDDKGNLIVVMEIRNQKTNEEACINQPFDRKLYDKIYADYEVMVDSACDYLFNTESAYNLLNIDTNNYTKDIFDEEQYALIEDINGETIFAHIPPFNKNHFKKDDIVILCNDTYNSKGKIHALCEFSKVNAPFNVMRTNSIIVLKKAYDNFETSADSDEEIENDLLLEKLNEFKKDSNKMPFDLIKESDVIVGMISTLNIPIEELSENLAFGSEHVKQKLVTNRKVKTPGDKPLLCVFLDHNSFDNCNLCKDASKMIFTFDDIAKHVIQSPELFGGIIINPNKDDIEITTRYLIDDYLSGKTMNNDKRFIKTLEKLNEKEIEYLGDENYKYISMIYFENKNPKMISQELKVSIDRIGMCLFDGYKRLKEIIKSNYS